MDIRDKVAIITGGLGGIGFATVEHLIRKGANFVAITDLALPDSDVVTNRLNELKREFNEDKFQYYRCNVRNITEFIDCYDKVVQQKGYIDIVINNAGIINDNDVDAIIGVNFTAVVNNTMVAIKRMEKLKSGVVVNIGSNLGLINSPAAMPVYNATKHAVVSFVRSMKIHNDTLGVRIVCLCPGLTKTKLIMASVEESSKNYFDFVDQSCVHDMLRHHQQSPDSVASAIVGIIENGKSGDVWFAWKDEAPFAVGEETNVEKLKIPF